MRLSVVMGMAVVALSALAGAAAAAVPTRVALTAPTSVDLGEEILLEARLVTADGQPVADAPLELRQVGAVGERVMAQSTTDADGTATFVHREYSVASLALRVAFAGGPAASASHADVLITINGVEPKPAVVMSHAPSLLVKGILFSLLGTIWFTYIYAVSRVVRVARETGGGRSL